MISCSVERQRSVQQTTMPTAIDKLIDEIMASDDDFDDEDDGESVASDEAAALSKLSSVPAAGDAHELIAELMNINDDDDESVASDGEYCDCLEEELSYIDEDERGDSERAVLHSPSSADEVAASGDSAENNDNASSRPTDDEAYDDEDDGRVGVRGGEGGGDHEREASKRSFGHSIIDEDERDDSNNGDAVEDDAEAFADDEENHGADGEEWVGSIDDGEREDSESSVGCSMTDTEEAILPSANE